jgi:segregation and condensation protein B
MTESVDHTNDLNIKAILEGLLFISPGPVALSQLATFLDKPLVDVENALHELDESYLGNSGLCIQWYAGRIQMTTAPQLGQWIEKFLGLESNSRLSRAALEALAILAYQQPATRPQIDAIRGVSSDGVLKSLLSKGLIQELGRAEGPGRPIIYGTTAEFLQHFGLTSLTQLPPLETFMEKSENTAQDKEFSKE